MPDKPLKSQIFEQLARIAKAAANANRLELLEFLAQGERTVDSLAREARQSVANTSHHLQVLRQAGLVEPRRDGQRIFYRLSDESVVELMSVLGRIADKQLADLNLLVTTFLTSRDSMEPLAAKELFERIKEGSIIILDVRPPEEYASGHLPGAINIPLMDLDDNLDKLPPGQEVIAYCRGPYCVLSFEAVALLRAQGIQARRLENGLPEWRLAGFPVEGKQASGMTLVSSMQG